MSVLEKVARGIDFLNEWIGRTVAWLLLVMVVVQFAIVIMRYVYGMSSIFVQESIVYMHATLFMIASAYTLKHDGHVRVDVFYRDARPKMKALVNFLGSIVFLLPVCAVFWWRSWDFVIQSWAVHEGSRETSGLQAIYLLKTELWLFAALMGLQGISLAIHSWKTFRTGVPDSSSVPPEERTAI
jgi:TRAP-type mannitol/chloroaromatic compound transport system permease small subunit